MLPPVQRRGACRRGPGSIPLPECDRRSVELLFCPNASCPVVFFLNYDVIDDCDVLSHVGREAASKPLAVCFCFGYTGPYDRG